jgi:hypothetical protein
LLLGSPHEARVGDEQLRVRDAAPDFAMRAFVASAHLYLFHGGRRPIVSTEFADWLRAHRKPKRASSGSRPVVP